MSDALIDAVGKNQNIKYILNASYAQYHGGGYEHNFNIVKPWGYQPAIGTADPNILLFDPWRTILPNVYLPANRPTWFPANLGIQKQ